MKKTSPILFLMILFLIQSAVSQDIRTVDFKFPGQDSIAKVKVEVKDERVFIDDDIVLCGLNHIERSISNGPDGAYVSLNSYRWPDNTIYYDLNPSHKEYSNIIKAIQHLENETNLNFKARTNEENYIRFIQEPGTCWSYVGMQGGMQEVNIGGTCGFGAAVHELCHAAGMYHEHSRSDRDTYVRINWSNIETGKDHNFQTYIQRGFSGQDYGNYDYGSIMHYANRSFSKNGQKTIEIKTPPAKSGTTIGQRNGLSDTDISTINYLYPDAKINIELYSEINIDPIPLCQGKNAHIHVDCVNRGGNTVDGFFAVDLHEFATGDFVAELGRTGDVHLPSNHHFTNGLDIYSDEITVLPDKYLVAVWFWDYAQGEWEYVKNGSYKNAIEVDVENCSAHYLNLNPSHATIESNATYYSFEVDTDDFWEVEYNSSWIKNIMPIANYTRSAITLEKNYGPERSASITVLSDNGLQKTFTLIQKEFLANLFVDKSEIQTNWEGGKYYFNIESNANWVIAESESWLDVNKPSGKGNSEIAVTISPNNSVTSRMGQLEIKGAGQSYILSIIQDGKTTTNTSHLPIGIEHANISPNPASDQLRLELRGPSFGLMQVDVFSSSLQHCFSQSFNKLDYATFNSFDLRGLPSGNYYLRLTTSSGIWQSAFLKI